MQGRALRVALVTSSYNYIPDGVALTLNRLVGYLERQGIEVRVFAPTARQPAFAHQGTVVPVPSIPLPGRPEYRLALGMAGYVKRQLLDFQPDIIHIGVPDLLGHAALQRSELEIGIQRVVFEAVGKFSPAVVRPMLGCLEDQRKLLALGRQLGRISPCRGRKSRHHQHRADDANYTTKQRDKHRCTADVSGREFTRSGARKRCCRVGRP